MLTNLVVRAAIQILERTISHPDSLGSLESVKERYKFTQRQIESLLLKLDKLRIVDYYPNGKFSFRVSPYSDWRENGPLRAKYGLLLRSEFMGSKFTGPGEFFRMIGTDLSEHGLKLVDAKIKRLLAEIKEITESERAVKSIKTRRTHFVFAYRIWNSSILSRYRKP